jgi:hypothetical protein
MEFANWVFGIDTLTLRTPEKQLRPCVFVVQHRLG